MNDDETTQEQGQSIEVTVAIDEEGQIFVTSSRPVAKAEILGVLALAQHVILSPDRQEGTPMPTFAYRVLSPAPAPIPGVNLSTEDVAYEIVDLPAMVTSTKRTACRITEIQGEETVSIYPDLEDVVRLGRIAQAILEGREPALRNYDELIELL